MPLGSYDLLIGMEWLEQHRVILNCYDKTFTCLNSDEKPVSVKGISRKTTVSVRIINPYFTHLDINFIIFVLLA